MTYKIINNELFIARRVVLKGYEKDILEILLEKQHDVSLVKICNELGLKPVFAKEIIESLKKKVDYNWLISVQDTNGWLYYRIKPRKD